MKHVESMEKNDTCCTGIISTVLVKANLTLLRKIKDIPHLVHKILQCKGSAFWYIWLPWGIVIKTNLKHFFQMLAWMLSL